MNTVLITGGSGKVGYRLVNHFLSLGFTVVTTTRDKNGFYMEKNNSLHADHEHLLKVVEVDFTQASAVETIVDFLQKEKIVLHSVIHNARSVQYLKIEDDYTTSEQNFAGELHMDVIFPYLLTMRIVNDIHHNLQNIVFISSIYGVVAPNPSLYDNFFKSSPINYGVSKAAQIHLTKELAVRLAPDIRVNCISFGGIKGRTDSTFIKRYESLNPLNKMLEEEDVVGPISFLISDNSKNMTGQNILIDGGWTIW